LPVPRVLRGVLRAALPGAARWLVGRLPARRNADLPQLGPARAPPDLRGVAAGAGLGQLMAASPPHSSAPAPHSGAPPTAGGMQAVTIDSHLDGHAERSLADDVLDGLTRPFKELPPKHFYDARGAELFDRICELPEYYPTRAERAILERSAEQIA